MHLSQARPDPAHPNQAYPNRASLVGDYGRLPLHFEENRGQTDAQVKFLSRGAGYALFLTGDEAVLQLRSAGGPGTPHSALRTPHSAAPRTPQLATLRLKLLGANPEPQITGLDQLKGKANYFTGSDPSRWRSGIPTYAKVHYRNVYTGVDLVYYGNQRQLEHDFVVAPRADPKQIRLAVEGAERVELEAQGDAVLRAGDGEVRLRAPVAYQPINGRRQPVAARYALSEGTPHSALRTPHSQELAFELGAYDPTLPLVIDPVLVYSTYLGGGGNDVANGIAVDSSGYAYIIGQTLSTDFPTNPPGARRGPGTAGASIDVFVAKLNTTGSALVFSTYLGGSGDDVGTSIAVCAYNYVYITGLTTSADFPTYGVPSSRQGTQDAFVTKLDPAGSGLVYSTYLGGGDIDAGRGIAVDSNGNVYVTGETYSTDFPTLNASQSSNGAVWDAFVTKLSGAGSRVYSTYLGGNSDDFGTGIAVDSSFNAYVTGYTRSTTFPTSVGALQTAVGGGYDAFVTKLNAAGSTLVYSTHLGGNSTDYGRGIAVDSNGNAYVTGLTASANFPAVSAFQGALGSNLGTCSPNDCFDAFAAKLNAAGSSLMYSTYLGGALYDAGNSIAVDSSGNAYVAGATTSTNFPTASAYQSANNGVQDAFVLKLNPGGSVLAFSTYLGGAGIDGANGVAVDPAGGIYVAGEAQSSNFPTTAGVLQPGLAVAGDAFVAKFTPRAELSLGMTAPDTTPSTSDFSYTLTVTNNGPDTATGVVLTDMLPTPVSYVTYTGPGECTGTVTVTCTLPAIPNGGNVVITLTVHPLATGPVTNTASVTAGEPDPNPTNNSASAGTLVTGSGSGGSIISSLSPPNAAAGSPAFTLTINGSSFAQNSMVYWNEVAVPANYVSSTKLTAEISGDHIATPATVQVTVFDPMGGGWSNSAPFLVYTAGGSASTISSLSPPKAVAGGPAFTLTINGSGFGQNSSVYWNGVVVPRTYVSSAQLQAEISADYIAAPTAAQVRVFDPMAGGWSNGLPFVVYSLSGQAGCVAPPADLKLWWPAENDSSDIASGAYTNNYSVGYSPGKVGLAFDMGGNSYLLEVPTEYVPPMTSRQITIDAWIMPKVSNGRIVDKLDMYGTSGYALEIFNNETGSYLRLIIGTAGGPVALPSTAPLPTNGSAWTHVTGVFDGANLKLYINGALAGSGPATGASLYYEASLKIGAGHYGGGTFYGLIDELEIFDRALTQEEIAGIVGAGSVGKCWAGVVPGAAVPVDLMLSKSAPDPAPLDYEFAYILTVINTSPDPAYGVVVTDTLPPGMSLEDAYAYPGSCTVNGSTITCSLGTLWEWSYGTVEVWVYTSQPGLATNAASVSSVNPDSNMNNNISSVEVTVGVLPPAISYTNPDSAVAGSEGLHLGVFGSYLTEGSVVRWNGSDRESAFCPYGQALYIDLTAEDLAKPGVAQITVYNPDTGLESAPYSFVIYTNSPQGCAPPPSGMVSWWPGEGNGSDVFGRNPGTLTGPVAFAPGMVSGAFSLDGNSYVEAPDSPSLAISNYITIDAWIKRTADTPGCATIVDKITPGGADGFLLAVCPDEGQYYYLRMAVGPWVVNGSTPLPLGEFRHVAGVFDGYELYLYLDGVEDGYLYVGGGGDETAQGRRPGRMARQSVKGKLNDYDYCGYPLIPINHLSLRIGANHEEAPGEKFVGLIDEVEIYNRALYGGYDGEAYGEIGDIFLAGPAGKCNPFACAPPPSDLVSWWPGQTDGRDLAGANPAAPQGNVTFAPAMVGNGFSLDGSSYMEVSDSPSLAIADQITIDAWIKRTGDPPPGSCARIVDKITPEGADGFLLDVCSAEGYYLRMVVGTSVLHGTISLPLNEFVHVAGVFDGYELNLYVNGAPDPSGAVYDVVQGWRQAQSRKGKLGGSQGELAIPTNNLSLRIGANQLGAETFIGLIDEVEIYGRALSPEEIASIYMAGGAGKCTAPYSPDLALTKEATLNSNLTYTLTVINNSPQSATGVTVIDPLPAGVSFVSATPSQGTCTTSMMGVLTLSCDLGTVAGGAVAGITLVTQPMVSGEVVNAAAVTLNEPDPDTSNNMATVMTMVTVSPLPVITSIYPVERAAGSGGFVLTVGGLNFVSGATVQWAGSPRSTTYLSGTELTAQISDADALTAGTFLVTVVNPAPGGGTSAAMPFTIHAVGSYLVGDAWPASGNNSGQFGDESLDNLDLILALRAVTSVPGFLPPNCADLFDAMDSYPTDGGVRGGDGLLDNLDLIATLRRVTNADTSRPRRPSRGLVCGTMAPGLLPMLAGPAELPSGAGALEFQREPSGEDGAARIAVYLAAYRDVDLGGLSLAFGWTGSSLAAQAPLRFVSAAAGAPALLDNRLPGTIAAAWLGGLRLRAGQRLLLGFVDLPAAGGQVSFPVLHGVKANDQTTGRQVPIGVPRSGRTTQSPTPR